ncbi:MAG: twin-arginine translocase TatA/TatE family subunit [Acidimicrobiia bacterium]|nr:twin-arginine translocase TatA/TatE family subunit [Acidimicrobiia bacterium]
MGSLGSTELIIILIIILLVFGSTKLPKLARSLGQAQKEFKSGMTDAEREESEEKARAVEVKAELNRSETDLRRSEAERAEARKDSPSS